MTQPRLFDLFGDLTAGWPRRLVQQDVGWVNPLLPAPDPTGWLSALNAAVTVDDIHTGTGGDRVSLRARLRMPVPALSGAGWPFVLADLPDVEFRIQAVDGADRYVELFVSAGPDGVEVLLERLPVEIRLPGGLIAPVDEGGPYPVQTDVGAFVPGRLDDLRIVYRQDGPTSVYVHVRLHMTTDQQFTVRPAVPISFDRCLLSGMPCLAVHDLQLIPSPAIARDTTATGQRLDHLGWLRHDVTPWVRGVPFQGQFAVRAVHLDPDAEPVAGLAKALRGRSRAAAEDAATAEFVLDDLVVPFFSPYLVPIPRHISAGLRRRTVDPTSKAEVYSFEDAPVVFEVSKSPPFGLLIESLFFRSPADPAADAGVRASVAFFFSPEVSSANNALTLGVGGHNSIMVGYRRDYTDRGLPGPTAALPAGVEIFLHHVIGPVVLDIMALELGYSISRAVEGKPFKESFIATADLFVTMPASGAEGSWIRLRSLNGQPIAFGIQGVGWRFGKLALDGVSLPDGVQVLFGPVALVIEKLGVVAAHGASYLVISGGVAVTPPSGFELAAGVRDLRIKLRGGDHGAPGVTLGGFLLRMRIPDVVRIEVGGHFLDEVVGDVRRREFGLTGTVEWTSGSVYLLGIDLLVGSIRPVTAGDDDAGFRYLMAQLVFRGAVMLGPAVQLTRARLLFARNMQPKLPPPDPAARELRYLSWYRNSDPVTVPGDRRLAAWQPREHQLAVGVGVAASFPGLSAIVEISLFVLVLLGDDERGLLVVGEVFVLAPRPVALLAIEWDGKEERFSLLFNVELTLGTFLKNPPPLLADLARLSGSVYLSTDPTTFAVGRLADQRTWLGVRAELTSFGTTQLLFAALCFEKVDRPEGPFGFGFVVGIEGGFTIGVAGISMYAGLGLVVAWFGTGSVDHSVTFFVEAALRLTLFGFLRFAVEVRFEVRALGAEPRRGEARVELHVETPWFLPDVTLAWSHTWGRLAPQELGTSSAPMSNASALTAGPAKSLPVHTARIDPIAPRPDPPDPSGTAGGARTFSLAYLQNASPGEADRLAGFEADGATAPVPTDVTIAIDFSVPLTDRVGLGPLVSAAADQRAGELTLRYELVGLSLRRRPRYGTGRVWTAVDQRVELSVDFTGPDGPRLTGSLSPSVVTAFWDTGIRVAGASAAKRLLLNAVTPFEVQVSAPENDERILTGRWEWPCCPGGVATHQPRPAYVIHRADFSGLPPGTEAGASPFSESASVLRTLQPARVRPCRLDPNRSGELVAAFAPGPQALLARADLDEDAAYVAVVLGVAGPQPRVELLGRSADDTVVADEQLTATGGVMVTLLGTGPIRHVELYAAGGSTTDVELVGMAYVGLADLLHEQRSQVSCLDPAYRDFVQGRGRLAFLPNHDYEIGLTTRVTLTHPAAGPTVAEVTEYALFRTKGLPGLNAVDRPGDEVHPHVRAVYPPADAAVYREEPITLALRESLPVVVPLDARPQGPAEAPERTQLLRLALVARPESALVAGTPMTSAAPDWLTAHRSDPGGVPGWWRVFADGTAIRAIGMRSDDPKLRRLAGLIRPGASRCGLTDPRDVTGVVLAAGPPDTGDGPRWPAGSRLRASLVRANAPFVHRPSFESADLTALSPLTTTGSTDRGSWTVTGGRLTAAAGARRLAVLGDPDWDHLTVRTELLLAPGAAAGVAVGLPTGPPTTGLYAVVVGTAAAGRLELRRWGPSAVEEVVASAELPAAPDPQTAVGLEITVFDDTVRARVGEVTVQAARDAVREGRIALVADGAVTFADLAVDGLELYRFAVSLSRYASFAEHIGSFTGDVATIAPGDLGPGTSTATPAQLWAATGAQLPTAAAPGADPVQRDALFQRWVRELGLPLTQDVPGLTVTAYRAGGAARALLLESPEPLDVARSVTVSVTYAATTPVAVGGPVVLAAQQLLGARRPTVLPPLLTAVERVPDSALLSIELTDEGLALLDLTYPQRSADPAQPPTVQAVAVVGPAHQRQYVVLTGPPPVDGAAPTVVLDTRVVHDDPAALTPFGRAEWAMVSAGTVVLLTVRGPVVVAEILAVTDERPVPVTALADLTSRSILVLPAEPGAPMLGPFDEGPHRIGFTIDRARYDTTDPPDEISHYHRTARLDVTL